MSRLVLLLIATLLIPSAAGAQIRSAAQNNYSEVELRIRLMYANLNDAPKGLVVELYDQFGAPRAGQILRTDSSGQANFRGVPPGLYRLSIKGENIEDTLTPTFEVMGFSGSHQEVFRVYAKVPADQVMGTAPVSAASLKVPKNAREEYEKGNHALGEKKLKEARERFEKALEIYPDFSEAYNSLGVINMQEDKKEEGMAAFQKAIELDPDSSRPYLNLARIYDADKKFFDVYRLLTKYVTMNPSSAEAFLMLAKAEAFGGKVDLALEHCRKVHLLQHQDQAGAHLLAARILSRKNQPQEAAAEYSLFMTEAPKDPAVEEAKRMIKTLQSANRPQ